MGNDVVIEKAQDLLALSYFLERQSRLYDGIGAYTATRLEGFLNTIEECHNYWSREVAELSYEYNDCLRYGPDMDCSGLAKALEIAIEKLKEVSECRKAFDNATADYIRVRSKMSEFTEKELPNAEKYLIDTVKTVENLLGQQVPEPSRKDVVGIKPDHGYAYQKARYQMAMNYIFDSNADPEIKKSILYQVKDGRNYIKSPIDKDAGHIIPGLHLPENLVWEDKTKNRGKTSTFRRVGWHHLFS